MPVNPSEVPIEYKGYLHKHGRIFRVSDSRDIVVTAYASTLYIAGLEDEVF